MTSIFNRLRMDIANACSILYPNNCFEQLVNVVIPKDSLNGDLSTNIAMILGHRTKKNIKEIAIKIRDLLLNINYITHIEIAKSGFINFTIRAEEWQVSIMDILQRGNNYIQLNIGCNKKANVEYLSANPTGPIHIGHARCAIYGDVLAKLLKRVGYDVTKEYYVNDAGSQIYNLIKTALIRYKEIITGEKILYSNNITDSDLYYGEYVIDVGHKLVEIFGDQLLALDFNEQCNRAKIVIVKEMMNIIMKDLNSLDIKYDVFFSEQSLHNNNKISEVVEHLTNIGLIYEGKLPEPKSKSNLHWQERVQKLFKSTLFGDDMDRAVTKSDGEWSYFAADLAYFKNKIDRGYNCLVCVLGSDHIGYIKRIKAIVHALSNGTVNVDIKICQLVNIIKDSNVVRMSKRKGTFIGIRDIVNEVGIDIVRFVMLMYKNDTSVDFDSDKLRELSKENPVFYFQYAHVRTVSILHNANTNASHAVDKLNACDINLSLLSSEEEIYLIKLLAFFPKIIESAAATFDPHKIAIYLLDIAARFHNLWNLGKKNNDYRFIISDNMELTTARIALVRSVQIVIRDACDIIGIIPLQKM